MADINILFITFYGLIEYIADIVNGFDIHAEELSEKGITLKTYDIPYLHLEKTEMMNSGQIFETINALIRSKEITHIFWFFFPEDDAIMKNIYQTNQIGRASCRERVFRAV